MTRKRKCFVYWMLAGILGGHLVCVVVGAEAWPFSRYPMYANASNNAEEFKQWQIVGIPVDEQLEEFELPAESLPRIASLNAAINRVMRERTEGGRAAEERLESGLRGLVSMYYQHQRKNEIPAVPMREVRLYRRTWERGSDGEPMWVEQVREMEVRVFLDEAEFD